MRGAKSQEHSRPPCERSDAVPAEFPRAHASSLRASAAVSKRDQGGVYLREKDRFSSLISEWRRIQTRCWPVVTVGVGLVKGAHDAQPRP